MDTTKLYIMNISRLNRSLVNFNTACKLSRMLSAHRMPSEQLHELRLVRLRRMLSYAFDHFEFYRSGMKSAGVDPRKITSLDDLKKLPVLDRRAYKELTASALKSFPDHFQDCFQDATSGSTGQPVQIYRSWDDRAYMLAKFMRVLVRNGYRPWHKMFWVASPVHIRGQDTLLQSLGIMKRHVASFADPARVLVEKIITLKPQVIYANKSHLVQMAMHICRNRINIPRPMICASVGEILDPVSLSLLQQAFGSDSLIDCYGSLELSNVAWRRISREDFFRVHHDSDILEVVGENGFTASKGTALITDLHIRSIPLIRYRLGDQMEVEYRDNLPSIKKIIGRTDDLLHFRDGTSCAGPMIEVVMEDIPGILQYRVIQESYDLVRVIIAAGDGVDLNEIKKRVLQGFKTYVSSDIKYLVEFTDNIPPDPNGKLRMLISRIAP